MSTLIWGGIGLPDAESEERAEFGVVVEGNRIIATGVRGELERQYPDTVRIGGDHLALIPAMINSHDHGRGLGTASLGVPDDLLEIWLPGLWSQPRIDPYLAAAFDGLRLLRSGVGTVAHSHNPLNWREMHVEAEAILRGYRDAGIRVAFHPPIINQNFLVYGDEGTFLSSLPPDAREAAQLYTRPIPLSENEYVALCRDLFHVYHDEEQHTVHIQVSPAGGQWCSDELILTSVEFARHFGTRVQMHMLETRYQRRYAHRRWGKSFIQHLDEIGALGPWLTCAHMIWVERDDLPLLADRGVAIAHNPSSNLRLRSGIAPVAAFFQAGIPVGVGLDGHALDEDQDYLRELRLAWTLANRPGATAPMVPSRAVWQAGTTGGAAVTMGPEVQLGRLVPGALADLVLLDWEAVRGLWAPEGFPPGTDMLDVLLRRASYHHVEHVMINGRWVVANGRSTTLDPAEIMAALRQALAQPRNPDDQRYAEAARILAPHLRRYYAAWDKGEGYAVF